MMDNLYSENTHTQENTPGNRTPMGNERHMLPHPGDPGSPNLRMVSWNLAKYGGGRPSISVNDTMETPKSMITVALTETNIQNWHKQMDVYPVN